MKSSPTKQPRSKRQKETKSGNCLMSTTTGISAWLKLIKRCEIFYSYQNCSNLNQSSCEHFNLLRTSYQLKIHMALTMSPGQNFDMCWCTSGNIINIGWHLMKLIRMMIVGLVSKSFRSRCQPCSDGGSREMQRNYLNKLISMGRAWYYSISSQPGQLRKNWILIQMMMHYDCMRKWIVNKLIMLAYSLLDFLVKSRSHIIQGLFSKCVQNQDIVYH